MADKVKLIARRRIWMGDGKPYVERGEEFETDQEVADILVEKGRAEVVKVARTRKTTKKEK